MDRGKRKVRRGRVISNKMEKSVVVAIETRKPHPLYRKIVKQTKKLMAHDEKNDCQIGDIVEVMETRPLSKHKKWRVVNIIEKSKES